MKIAPSNKHTELRNMAARWITNRAFKSCILPEAGIVGYIADLVAIAGMHNQHHERYARHSELTMKSMVSRHTDDGWERIISGDIDRWYVCVFEAKASRADFLHTFGGKDTPHAKARMDPVGTAHWVVADKGVCSPEELPDFWGLLEPYGAGLTEKKLPRLNVLSDSDIHAMAFDMLWLQMNYQTSCFHQMLNMGKAMSSLHRGILRDMPRLELLRRSRLAQEACNGLQEQGEIDDS